MSSEHGDRQASIDAVLAGLAASVDDSERERAEVYLRAYLQDAQERDLQRPDAVLGGALALYRFAAVRPEGEVLVRILNPQLSGDGWASEHTVLQIVTDDMPFLVDSVTGELSRRDSEIHLAVHPQLIVERDADGALQGIELPSPERKGGRRESWMHVEIDRDADPDRLADLEARLRRDLAHVRATVEDWSQMRREVQDLLKRLVDDPPPLPEEDLEEARAFLRWIDNHHFTFLGFQHSELREGPDGPVLAPVPGTGLGLLRDELRDPDHPDGPLALDGLRTLEEGETVAISKTRRTSTVHRPVHMDAIAIQRWDDAGRLVGQTRILGLFTSMAYSIAASRIPLVRRKVAHVLERARFLPQSHDAKSLRHILEHYPRDELFQISEDDLLRFALRILELQLRPRLALLVRVDENERAVTCMVYVPRERHSTRIRRRIQEIVEKAYGGRVTAYFTRISELPLAQVQLFVEVEGDRIPDVDPAVVEAELAEATRSWGDRLKEALVQVRGEEAGLARWRVYGEAFPVGYQSHNPASAALVDMEELEEVRATGQLGMRLYRSSEGETGRFHLRTFEQGEPTALSNILPILEDFGLEVISEIPWEVRPHDAEAPIWVRDFELLASSSVDLGGHGPLFERAFAQVWSGVAENDGFNRLVLAAGLGWREVVVLRAYSRYLRQTGIAFSQESMENALARHPGIAAALVGVFTARLRPEGDRSGVDELQAELQAMLDGIEGRDDDRILRRFEDLVHHTLRTNFWQPDESGDQKPYLSLKLNARRLQGLPEPRPQVEVFVYSPRVEAVHLRGGKVARGGIRWSDRREDFRTEILGLVKAQMVKNAVIVPVGAKGGFVVKRPPASRDREEMLAEGIACYRQMIRGLLDVTDNLSSGDVVPPRDVERRDEDDPYLVVAADKGTATFSDIANGVSAEYGFWLDDAFASGGSAGYDHKKMGITARGGWESVKRHFRETDKDIQTEDFTVVGVGDMSGDVFGNGMLLSKRIRLVAAFNHLHIFIDPDPDPEASWDERRRLFDLPRSTWRDYDASLLEASGGGVWERAAKTVTVTPQVVQLLGLPSETLTPSELIQAILRARVELLWFGGIGTYVKSTRETHADAGDRSNDDVRVDARELRCRVVGEGANLGLTQAGRIEAALAGVRLNTDFIDNSGGVDCSDHEVNIKIALAEAMATGELDREERNALLGEMTDEVAQLVLRDNYLQSQAITLTEVQGIGLLDEQAQLMRFLERAGRLDRKLEGLPDGATLDERREKSLGLTRPEIAVLLAHAKIFVFDELLDSALPDDPLLVEDLRRYFPAAMCQRFPSFVEGHRLRREIIATYVTNSLVNRVGPTFVLRMSEEIGCTVSEVARAYTAARDVFDMRSLWEDLEALDNAVTSEYQTRAYLDAMGLLERATRWFLLRGGRPLDVSACVGRYQPPIIMVAAQLEEMLPTGSRARLRRRYRRLEELGFPIELARRVAGFGILPAACDVAHCALATDVGVEEVGKAYFAIGERFGFDRLRRDAEKLAIQSQWQQAAVGAILDDLLHHQARLTEQVVELGEKKAKAGIQAWAGRQEDRVARIDRLLADFGSSGGIDLAMLSVAEREIRRLVGE